MWISKKKFKEFSLMKNKLDTFEVCATCSRVSDKKYMREVIYQYSHPISSSEVIIYCGNCAPKFDVKIYLPNSVYYKRLSVRCDEDGNILDHFKATIKGKA